MKKSLVAACILVSTGLIPPQALLLGASPALQSLREQVGDGASPAPTVPSVIQIASLNAGTCQTAAGDLHDGDILFLERNHDFFGLVAQVTRRWLGFPAGHLGIAFLEGAESRRNFKGEWYVYESWSPRGVRTPLCKYIEKSHGGTARGRVRLSESQLRALRAWATNPSHYGLPYDHTFSLNAAGSTFCSKFVYQAFQSLSPPIMLGRPQTFQEIADAYRGADREALLRQADAFFRKRGLTLRMNTLTITPQSIYQDSNVSSRRL